MRFLKITIISISNLRLFLDGWIWDIYRYFFKIKMGLYYRCYLFTHLSIVFFNLERSWKRGLLFNVFEDHLVPHPGNFLLQKVSSIQKNGK